MFRCSIISSGNTPIVSVSAIPLLEHPIHRTCGLADPSEGITPLLTGERSNCTAEVMTINNETDMWDFQNREEL
jgi:hypothetical protein